MCWINIAKASVSIARGYGQGSRTDSRMFIPNSPLALSRNRHYLYALLLIIIMRGMEAMMKYLRQAIRSYSGLLLAGAVLLQANLLPAQNIPIAVVEFEGNGISQTEAIALTDRLRNELFRLGAFEVVERGMMETILTEQDFQLTGCTSNECLVEVGQLLGARQVVGGRISRVGAMFTVSARVVDVETGKLLGVSDFDLRGGLEELLTMGMKQVALMLSGGEAATTAIESRPDIRDSNQPASRAADDQLPRTWSINAGFGSSRNANFLEITKDLFVGSHFSLFVSAGVVFENMSGGIAYRRRYNEKGLVLSTSVGLSFMIEEFTANTLIAYQWPLGRRGFLVTGAGLLFIEGEEIWPYPVLSYEYRF